MKKVKEKSTVWMVIVIMLLQIILPLCSMERNKVESAGNQLEQKYLEYQSNAQAVWNNRFEEEKGYYLRQLREKNKMVVTGVYYDGIIYVFNDYESNQEETSLAALDSLLNGYFYPGNSAPMEGYEIFIDCSVSKLTGHLESSWLINTIYGGDGITEIPEAAFYSNDGTSKLENIVGFNNCITIGKRAFEGCKNLKRVYAFVSVKEIKWRAFYNCSALEIFNTCIFHFDSKGTFIETPNTERFQLTIIGPSAFSECIKLEQIGNGSLPAIKTIGAWAFNNCKNLKLLYKIPTGLKVGEKAFKGCTKLTIDARNTTNTNWEGTWVSTVFCSVWNEWPISGHQRKHDFASHNNL